MNETAGHSLQESFVLSLTATNASETLMLVTDRQTDVAFV